MSHAVDRRMRITRERGRQSDHPLFQTWREMCSRCHPNRGRADYGGKGIYVCERWRKRGGFWRFVDDMGPKPTPQHTLDRVDSEGPYTPDNCRWADHITQARNRRGALPAEAYQLAFDLWRDGHSRAAITRITEINSTLISGFCRGLELATEFFNGKERTP